MSRALPPDCFTGTEARQLYERLLAVVQDENLAPLGRRDRRRLFEILERLSRWRGGTP
jgi:hypothetical protein